MGWSFCEDLDGEFSVCTSEGLCNRWLTVPVPLNFLVVSGPGTYLFYVCGLRDTWGFDFVHVGGYIRFDLIWLIVSFDNGCVKIGCMINKMVGGLT